MLNGSSSAPTPLGHPRRPSVLLGLRLAIRLGPTICRMASAPRPSPAQKRYIVLSAAEGSPCPVRLGPEGLSGTEQLPPYTEGR